MFVSCMFYRRPIFSVYLSWVWLGRVTSQEAEDQPLAGSGTREWRDASLRHRDGAREEEPSLRDSRDEPKSKKPL